MTMPKSFESQAKILLLFIALGFLLVCVIGFLALFGLKDEYDTSLANHLHKSDSLQKIQVFYTKLASAKPSATDPATLLNERESILDRWEAYKLESSPTPYITGLKRFYGKIFLQSESSQIAQLLRRRAELIARLDTQLARTAQITQQILQEHQGRENSTSHYDLLAHSTETNALLNELFENDIITARVNNHIADSLYIATLWLLLGFACLVCFGTLYFASIVLAFVRSINHKLQQRIDIQTHELKLTNQNLQKTIAHEIEQSRKKDQIMYQQARLASMGEMIQNIAHQWRQPLNSLIILFQSFKLKYEQQKLTDDFVARETEFALQVAKNMSETIENFRNFFRPNLARERFSVAKSIQDSIRLIKPTLEQNNIQVFFSYKQDVEILGYENAFSQVVLNIIKNSQDIFTQDTNPERSCVLEDVQGIVQITLECEHATRNKVQAGDSSGAGDYAESSAKESSVGDSVDSGALDSGESLAKELDEYVTLTLMDNGGGIKLHAIDKIFEPYFTTKHKSIGTGIGLYMVKQIVERQMGGSIEVRNGSWEYGGAEFFGAIFMIRFPLTFDQDS